MSTFTICLKVSTQDTLFPHQDIALRDSLKTRLEEATADTVREYLDYQGLTQTFKLETTQR